MNDTVFDLDDATRDLLLDLPAETLAHLASLAREREAREARGEVDVFEKERQRLAHQARLWRVARAMVIEDEFDPETVALALADVHPDDAELIEEAVAEAVAELMDAA